MSSYLSPFFFHFSADTQLGLANKDTESLFLSADASRFNANEGLLKSFQWSEDDLNWIRIGPKGGHWLKGTPGKHIQLIMWLEKTCL